MNNSTICAISTAPGQGAIALIRLSGNAALETCSKIFSPKSKTDFTQAEPNSIHFGEIKDADKIIDEVLVSVFRAPKSYTGEDLVEIACHGSAFIQQSILQLLLKNGAEIASPGEFTMRAYLNGKMDLSQAEAVSDLISSQTQSAHRLAISQMRGGFSQQINLLREQLLHFVSMIELELDFSEEDVEFADRTELKKLLDKISTLVNKLKDSFKLGNVIKNGVPVAIVGEPNVGKSTLLNSLLQEEKAIVSDIPGTTRDYIEDLTNIGGVLFRFVDTAGLRNTEDTIENLGIERTRKKLNEAQIVLWLTDDKTDSDKLINEVRQYSLSEKQSILVCNKTDIDKQEHAELALLFDKTINISAKYHKNIDELKNALLEMSNITNLGAEDVVVTNARHYDALSRASESLQRADEGLTSQIPEDLLSQDIRDTLRHLGEITGEIGVEDVLGNIFANFCIGK